jgi:integrase
VDPAVMAWSPGFFVNCGAFLITHDLIACNAASDAEVVGSGANENRQIAPRGREIMRQLIELANERFRVVQFAASTGVRVGEPHVLRWRHINFDRKEVRIESRVRPYRDKDVPEIRAGLRTVPPGEGVVRAPRGRCRPMPRRTILCFRTSRAATRTTMP